MYKVLSFVLILFSIGCASSEDNERVEPAVGEISIQSLFIQYPHFAENFHSYQPSEKEITAIQKVQGKSILVLFGTWCHDSEREIPRLLKLLEVSNVQLAALSLRALNYSKQDTQGLHHTYQLNFTPTIILLDGKKELGRIVEFPKVSLGEDLANMLSD